jgi:DNA-binding transcriptional ArsR family regulator
MTKMIKWDLKRDELNNRSNTKEISIREVSVFFGDSIWSRISAYLIQSNRSKTKGGLTSKQIVRSMLIDFPDEIETNLKRAVDRTLERMIEERHVISDGGRPRKFRLNSKKRAVRELQSVIGRMIEGPEVARAAEFGPHPNTLSIERLVIGGIQDQVGDSGEEWASRSDISGHVAGFRDFTDPRISQVLSKKEGSFGLGEMGMVEERREGWYKFYRLAEAYSSMSADDAYEAYRLWRVREGRRKAVVSYSRNLSSLTGKADPDE